MWISCLRPYVPALRDRPPPPARLSGSTVSGALARLPAGSPLRAGQALTGASLVPQLVRIPCNAGDPAQPLGWEDPLEKETATRSSILAWRSMAGYGPWGHKNWTRLWCLRRPPLLPAPTLSPRVRCPRPSASLFLLMLSSPDYRRRLQSRRPPIPGSREPVPPLLCGHRVGAPGRDPEVRKADCPGGAGCSRPCPPNPAFSSSETTDRPATPWGQDDGAAAPAAGLSQQR